VNDEELRLNRLSAYRYRKTSSRLALEVHSSCEVPAGCGGVVLRWRTADGPVGVSFSFWTNAATKPVVTIDGDALVEQRVTVAPGAHVAALQVSLEGDASHDRVDVASFRCLGRAVLDPEIGSALVHDAHSGPDGRWRMTTSPPPAGWQRPTFVDDAWPVMVPRAAPESPNDWSLSYLSKYAEVLGPPDADAVADVALPSAAAKSVGGVRAFFRRAVAAPLAGGPRAVWMRWHFTVGGGGFS
jgi:hypothetical protein